MIYLTFADAPSGVFSSQVIDVCKFLEQEFGEKTRLVAFISGRDFKKNKQKIKSESPSAIILPMFPKLGNWRWNAITLFFVCLITGKQSVLARNVLAANLALMMKRAGLVKKAGYDGRGAIAAEWNEYKVTTDENLKKEIAALEKNAVLKSDFCIAVSSKLVEYWREKFGYGKENYVVIPCTLNKGFSFSVPGETEITETRRELGFENDDVIMVYSGSTAGWQSFQLVYNFISSYLRKIKRYKILFMSEPDELIERTEKEFPGQVQRKWVVHRDVQRLLSACDYGILIRENSVTNRVASPTKFAEYLSAGLYVLISEGIGDYTDFTAKHKCGIVVNASLPGNLEKPSAGERKMLADLVKTYFTKEAQKENYRKLIEQLK